MTRYADHIHRDHAFAVPPISAERLREACIAAAPIVEGLDSWQPRVFSYLANVAYQGLADLLNAIENGLSWPKDLLEARAAFLSKSSTPDLSPLEYRVLLILPALYRRWANVRLRDTHDWVCRWMDEALFAGSPGFGSEEAWYSTALWAELCARWLIGD